MTSQAISEGSTGHQVNNPLAPVIQGTGNTVTINYGNYSPILPPENLQAGAPFRVRSGGSGIFVGRGKELADLQNLLNQPGAVAIAAAAGLGGVGKTALAQEYVRQNRSLYPAGIWWLEPGDRVGSLVIEAELLGWGKPPESAITAAQQVQWVYQQWFARFPQGQRLLVWDDGENFREIRPLLPTEPSFQVLLTTRNKWGSPVRRLDLDSLPRSDAFRLLRTLLNDDDRLRQEVPQAKALCEWLGYLPLAVELVGRYLSFRPVTLAKTLERLEEQRLAARALVQIPEEMDYRENVAAAFELSWQILEPPAQTLLVALSLFGAAPIPLTLIQSALPDWDEEDLEDGLVLLQQRSLLSVPKPAGKETQITYQLHTLVREFGRDKLNTELKPQADPLRRGIAAALVAVAKTVPYGVTLQILQEVEGAIPHLAVVAQELTDWIEDSAVITPMTRLAWLAKGQNRWIEAEQWQSQCLALAEQRFGCTHPDTAVSYGNLAGLYEAQGRYEEALPFRQKALAIHEQVLEPNHPYIATGLNNLAGLYDSVGRYEEALPLYQRSLGIREQALGANHPYTAQSLNNLAGLYEAMGRYEEALPLYQRSLEIKEQALGANHPDTAGSLLNLAALYHQTQRPQDALSAIQRALQIYTQTLGSDHPTTQLALSWLAVIQDAMQG